MKKHYVIEHFQQNSFGDLELSSYEIFDTKEEAIIVYRIAKKDECEDFYECKLVEVTENGKEVLEQ